MAVAKITGTQLNHLIDSKGNLTCIIDPKDFLGLTTPVNYKVDEADKDLASYIIAPHLKIDKDTGEILGHEGRHRAMKVLNEGNDLEIGIILVEDHWIRRRYFTAEDLPNTIKGQFNPGFSISKSKLKITNPDLQGNTKKEISEIISKLMK